MDAGDDAEVLTVIGSTRDHEDNNPIDGAGARRFGQSGNCAGRRRRGPKTAAQETPELEEIVVTAEKRESTVQKTPISMVAISQADIEARRGCRISARLLQERPASP